MSKRNPKTHQCGICFRWFRGDQGLKQHAESEHEGVYLEAGARVEVPRPPPRQKGPPICECGKRGFRSKGAAKRSMSKASNRVRAYRCPDGPYFHVTNRQRN